MKKLLLITSVLISIHSIAQNGLHLLFHEIGALSGYQYNKDTLISAVSIAGTTNNAISIVNVNSEKWSTTSSSPAQLTVMCQRQKDTIKQLSLN